MYSFAIFIHWLKSFYIMNMYFCLLSFAYRDLIDGYLSEYVWMYGTLYDAISKSFHNFLAIFKFCLCPTIISFFLSFHFYCWHSIYWREEISKCYCELKRYHLLRLCVNLYSKHMMRIAKIFEVSLKWWDLYLIDTNTTDCVQIVYTFLIYVCAWIRI